MNHTKLLQDTSSFSDYTFPNCDNISKPKSYLTVKQFAQKHPAFPTGGLRYLIFHEDDNGFHKCIRRIGRKILIYEEAFFEWLENQNGDPK